MSSDVINIDHVLASFEELWVPRVLATVNDWAVKLAKVQGDHVWHAHHETDEVFIVLSGHLDIHWRNSSDGSDEVHRVGLGPRNVHVVPRGVEHRPSSPAGAVLMLFEPAGTWSTGDFVGQLPSHISATTGFETG